MLGAAILLISWFGLGWLGAHMAYRGSMRDYGKDIYGKRLFAGSILFGWCGFLGSIIAW
jgi:hypothetical protein